MFAVTRGAVRTKWRHRRHARRPLGTGAQHSKVTATATTSGMRLCVTALKSDICPPLSACTAYPDTASPRASADDPVTHDPGLTVDGTIIMQYCIVYV